jgi:UDP-2,3-diacylglucosamine pyrophosphatase LpxH
MAKLKLAALWPDTHVKYHDRRAVKLVMRILKDLKIDELVLLGDFCDVYNLSSHGVHAAIKTNFIDEINEVNVLLDQFDKTFPKAKKVYISGNHEFRLERYINTKCPELFGVTQLDHLLKIPQRSNWTWVDYGPNQSYKVLGSHLTARHEPLGSSAKATASKALCSLVYGHIHRIEESHIVGLDGKNHVCFSVGWLGDKSYDKIFGYVKGHHQWQLGFGLVWVDPDTKYFYHQKVHILDNYSCVVNGKMYQG